MPSVVTMTNDELLAYKAHLHRLQSDFQAEANVTDQTARYSRLLALKRKVDARLHVVYTEFERRAAAAAQAA